MHDAYISQLRNCTCMVLAVHVEICADLAGLRGVQADKATRL